MKLERIAISCGGTGGHFNPGLSIARTFVEHGGQAVLILGGTHSAKQAETAASFGIKSIRISSASIPKNPLKMPSFISATWKGMKQTKAMFDEFKPQAILSMGSFTSLPPAIASFRYKVPLFLHDGNARVGKANRFLSRFAKAIALSFPTVNADKCACPAIITGMPLRPEIISGALPKEDAIKKINERWNCKFKPENPVLLVFGGSLGATSINRNVKCTSPDIPDLKKLQVIHLSGPGKLSEIQDYYEDSPCQVLVLESTGDMQLLYSAADMVISRSGGSTVSELAFYGKYSILVPYPFAADSHQDDNAAWLASAGGASILKDSECSPEAFVKIISHWLKNFDEYREKGTSLRAIATPKASQNVIDMIDNIIFSHNHTAK